MTKTDWDHHKITIVLFFSLANDLIMSSIQNYKHGFMMVVWTVWQIHERISTGVIGQVYKIIIDRLILTINKPLKSGATGLWGRSHSLNLAQ